MNIALTLSISLLGCWMIEISTAQDPVVTLTHGGHLRGLRTIYNNTPVDLFLGVRYAATPINRLRFAKPVRAAPWRGEVQARTPGNICSQRNASGMISGDEDCLFLDITIPGGVQTNTKRPVMVWIHGGGYTLGSGSGYLGAPLAVAGNVLVVSMNYRLGIFGFLSDGPGTGNFGLWDQRIALRWVQNNIEAFGGDPDMVTIFGESAGGGSVAAQTLNAQNGGLFKRAIQQSGTLFTPWGWYLSRNNRRRIVNAIRDKLNCNINNKVFVCFNGMSSAEVQNVIKASDFGNPWRPVPDNDFFPADFEENPSYELSKRFDLMSGMNGQEGGLFLAYGIIEFAAARNETINFENSGMSLDLTRNFLKNYCTTQLTPFAGNLCAEFAIFTYRLDRTRSNRDRAARLSNFLGEIQFNTDIVKHLRAHSTGNQSTYGYYFTETYRPARPNPFRILPYWLVRSANHGDELPFLFGSAFLNRENATIWQELLALDGFTKAFLDQNLQTYYRPFSENMMKMWTNFAKSGNPLFPARLSRTPPWPQFDLRSGELMELRDGYFRITDTPNAARLDLLDEHILSARTTQVNNDLPVG